MNRIVLGNIILLLGSVIMVLCGLIRKKRNLLLAQCGMFTLLGAGNAVLGGYTGTVANGISIVRNLVCLRKDLTLPLKLFFIALQTAFSVAVGIHSAWDWLPVAAACLFTWVLDSHSEIRIKAVIIASQLIWLCYDLHILAFTSAAFDVFTVLSNAAGILLLRKARKTA